MNRKTIVVSLLALFFLAPVVGFAAEKVEGVIMSRTSETLIVNGPDGKVTVVLTDDTKTKDNKELLGLRKQYMANTVLIPGLKVKVDGKSDGEGRVIEKTITVDGDDLETAEMIQTGLHPTAGQVTTNTEDIQGLTDRFSQLSDYNVKAAATVKCALATPTFRRGTWNNSRNWQKPQPA